MHKLTAPLEEIFKTDLPARDNFLARLFGLFSEDVVRHWCQQPGVRYENLGRPSLFMDRTYRHTLDFTLRDRQSGATYVAELKCELAWENYRYLRLTEASQLTHHTGAAFQALLTIARNPRAYEVRAAGKPTRVQGAILIWGAITEEGRQSVMDAYGFAEVLCLEEMIRDLRESGLAEWELRISALRDWSNALFDYLR